MKIVLSVLAIVLFLISTSYGQPAIRFNDVVMDFSLAGEHEQVERVFEFSNIGDQELVIEQLDAS